MELVKKHNDARIVAIQHSFAKKSTVYICKGFEIKYSHNFTGRYIEKAVYCYKSNKVELFDAKENRIKEQEGHKPKIENISKLRKASDGKSD